MSAVRCRGVTCAYHMNSRSDSSSGGGGYSLNMKPVKWMLSYGTGHMHSPLFCLLIVCRNS